MQSLCALAHYGYNMAGAYSCEQALLIVRQPGLPMQAPEEMFRRMVFNIIARNQDALATKRRSYDAPKTINS